MRSHRQAGFTLIELMVAMFLTVIVSMMVYTLYDVATGAFAATEAELRYLQAFRSITDKMEVELNSICYKVGYIPGPGAHVPGGYKPPFKAIDAGMLQIHFAHDYIGFYCSTDGRTVDRVEYYYNLPEATIEQGDGIDNDGDDPNITNTDGYTPDNGAIPCLLIDDDGCFMLRKTLDCNPVDWTYDEVDAVTGLNIYMQYDDTYTPAPDEPYYDADFLPLDFSVPGTKDRGDILASGIAGIDFWYIWTRRDRDAFQMAPTWPHDDDDLDGADNTPYTYGGEGQVRGLSYLCLPVAVQVDFTFRTRGMDRKLTKTVYLYSSLWNEFLNR